jgi:hypothetical protein
VPHLTAQFNSSGPILDVLMAVSAPRRRLLSAHGLDAPPALRLSLILDTGAETTMLNEQHLRTLAIPVRGQRDILTATSDEKPTACNTYDVSLQIPTYGDPPFSMPALEVLGRPLFNHSIDGMIGRDILSRVKLMIDGPRRTFRIDY